MTRFVFLLCFLTLSSSALAETVYVTDVLKLRVSERPNSGGKKVVTLISGDALTVLERQPGYVKVKAQGGEVGWVKAAYLVYEKPARLIVEQMQTQLEQLKKRLSDAGNNAQSASDNAEEMLGQLQTAEKNSLRYQDQLSQLTRQNREYESSIARQDTSVSFIILLLIAAACFLLGLYLSWYVIDYRARKRHGGFRL